LWQGEGNGRHLKVVSPLGHRGIQPPLTGSLPPETRRRWPTNTPQPHPVLLLDRHHRAPRKIAFSVDSGSSRPCRGHESPLLGDPGILFFRGAPSRNQGTSAPAFSMLLQPGLIVGPVGLRSIGSARSAAPRCRIRPPAAGSCRRGRPEATDRYVVLIKAPLSPSCHTTAPTAPTAPQPNTPRPAPPTRPWPSPQARGPAPVSVRPPRTVRPSISAGTITGRP